MNQYCNNNGTGKEEMEEENNEQTWLAKYKKILKTKMSDDIDYRYQASIKQVNKAIIDILQTCPQLNQLIISTNIPIINMDVNMIKNQLWSKVDEWKGAQYKNNDSWKAYKKRADGWYSRHKFIMLGDHFFNLLLNHSMPKLIHNLINSDSNPLSMSGYNLIFARVLFQLIDSDIPQKKTKPLPLIPSQTYLANSCKKTVQLCLRQIGDQHGVTFDNSKFKANHGADARQYAKEWISAVFRRAESEFLLQCECQDNSNSNRNRENGDSCACSDDGHQIPFKHELNDNNYQSFESQIQLQQPIIMTPSYNNNSNIHPTNIVDQPVAQCYNDQVICTQGPQPSHRMTYTSAPQPNPCANTDPMIYDTTQNNQHIELSQPFQPPTTWQNVISVNNNEEKMDHDYLQHHADDMTHSTSPESAGNHDIEPPHMISLPQLPNIPLYDGQGNLVYAPPPPAPYRPIRGTATTTHLNTMRSHPYLPRFSTPINNYNSTQRVYTPSIANTNVPSPSDTSSMHYGSEHGDIANNVPFGAPTPTPINSQSRTSVPVDNVVDVQSMTGMDSQYMNNHNYDSYIHESYVFPIDQPSPYNCSVNNTNALELNSYFN